MIQIYNTVLVVFGYLNKINRKYCAFKLSTERKKVSDIILGLGIVFFFSIPVPNRYF